MNIFKVTTGFGFIKEIATGKIKGKYELPIGDHSLKDGFEMVEVANKIALDAIIVDPIIKTPEEILEEKIQAEIRQMAIDSLTAKGKL